MLKIHKNCAGPLIKGFYSLLLLLLVIENWKHLSSVKRFSFCYYLDPVFLSSIGESFNEILFAVFGCRLCEVFDCRHRRFWGGALTTWPSQLHVEPKVFFVLLGKKLAITISSPQTLLRNCYQIDSISCTSAVLQNFSTLRTTPTDNTLFYWKIWSMCF